MTSPETPETTELQGKRPEPPALQANRGVSGLCKHKAQLVFNKFIADGKLEYDTRNFTTAPSLIDYINKKYSEVPQIGPDNLSRHKAACARVRRRDLAHPDR